MIKSHKTSNDITITGQIFLRNVASNKPRSSDGSRKLVMVVGVLEVPLDMTTDEAMYRVKGECSEPSYIELSDLFVDDETKKTLRLLDASQLLTHSIWRIEHS